MAAEPHSSPRDTQIAVGGRVTSYRAQGVKAAELALRALRGQPAGPADIVEAETALMFDWRQLDAVGPRSSIGSPAGSTVLYRPPSAWNLYKWPIIGIVAIALMEALLIGGLLIQRARRRRAESALDERLRFETLLADLSAILSHLPAGEMERQINRALRRLVEGLGVDRASLAEVTPGIGLAPVHAFMGAWTASRPCRRRSTTGGFPWTVKRAQQGHTVFFARLDELPPEAATDRQSYLAYGIKSLVSMPLTIGGSIVGVLTCGHLRSEREWPAALVHRLELLGDIFANALSRKQSEIAVRESKALASTIFTSLYGHVAAVDRDGVIIAVNESWTRFARENGGDPAARLRRRELPGGLAERDQPWRHGHAPGARGRRVRAGGPSAPGGARVRVPIARWRALVRDGGGAVPAASRRGHHLPRRHHAAQAGGGGGPAPARRAGPRAPGDDHGRAGRVAGP